MFKKIIYTLVLAGMLGAPYVNSQQQAAGKSGIPFTVTFDEVWQKMNANFYDPNMRGVNLRTLREKYYPLAEQAKTQDELSSVINRMLSEFNTSHTGYYTKSDADYYCLVDIMRNDLDRETLERFFPMGMIVYTGIGVYTTEINGGIFITKVLDKSPAARAGLKYGDRIVSVDGKPYQEIGSFIDKAYKDVKITVQSAADASSIHDVTVVPAEIKPVESFWDAMKGSVQVTEKEGVKIAYIHPWCFAGEQYYQLLRSEIAYGRLKIADALILDLRDGIGDASPYYLNIFNKNVPVITETDRSGVRTDVDFQWRKPVVMLVNEGTCGGSEVLASGFRKYKLGKIMGTPTAGCTMKSRLFMLKDGSVLMLPVADMLVDGVRIEGSGVQPDMVIKRKVEYSGGRDPGVDWAINVLFAEVMGKK
jgi:carboxyl-terminal processing protease